MRSDTISESATLGCESWAGRTLLDPPCVAGRRATTPPKRGRHAPGESFQHRDWRRHGSHAPPTFRLKPGCGGHDSPFGDAEVTAVPAPADRLRCTGRRRTRNDPARPEGGCRGGAAGPQRCHPFTSALPSISASFRSGRRTFISLSRMPVAVAPDDEGPCRSRPSPRRPTSPAVGFGDRSSRLPTPPGPAGPPVHCARMDHGPDRRGRHHVRPLRHGRGGARRARPVPWLRHPLHHRPPHRARLQGPGRGGQEAHRGGGLPHRRRSRDARPGAGGQGLCPRGLDRAS